ncbi:carbohydrate-binding module family 50 protein, partial [Bipolaris victoriae FI3]
CRDFPKQGRVCISSDAKCGTRTIKVNDTCATIADEAGVTWTQIVTWNPFLGIGCKGIKNYVGFTMCVSTPGGGAVDPSPEPVTPTLTFTLPPFVGMEASLLPAPTMGGMINGSDIWTFQFAEGTRMDCAAYANGTDFTSGASCDQVAAQFGSSMTDLIRWNPSLSPSSCKLDGQLTYCVRAVTLRSHNMTQYCTLEDVPSPGSDCNTFLGLWNLDKETFSDFNPSVGKKCENWALGTSYCVFTRHFRQSGIIATCNRWDMANVTDYGEDACGIFERKYGLTHGRFIAWNPMLNNDCSGMQRYNDYCVGVPGKHTRVKSQLAIDETNLTRFHTDD